jgi:hypothetical protein
MELSSANAANQYMNVMSYLDAKHPKLANMMRTLCVHMSLESIQKNCGVTFLVPQDGSFCSQLEQLTMADNPSDIATACDMVNAHVIRGVFKTSDDWKAKQATNALIPSQYLTIKQTGGGAVLFDSGAQAYPAPDFADGSKRQNVAVWLLKSGTIPVTSDHVADNSTQAAAKYQGSYDPGDLAKQNLRSHIALAVENAYAISCKKDDGKSNPYLAYTFSLINYIVNDIQDMTLFKNKVVPVFSYSKIDFYILLEPFRVNGAYLLDDAIIQGWWDKFNYVPPMYSAIKDAVTAALTSNGGGAAIYAKRPELLSEIDGIRQKICGTIGTRPKDCVTDVDAAYKQLETSNTIGAIGNVYPNELAEYYQANPSLKMIHDELKFLTHQRFKSFEAGEFDRTEFNHFTNLIAECLHVGGGGGYQGKLLNKNVIKSLISPVETIQEIKCFVCSTAFLCMPMTEAECSKIKQKYTTSKPIPGKTILFNISKDLYDQHNRLIGENDNNNLIAALRSIDVSKLDPALRQELLAKFT